MIKNKFISGTIILIIGGLITKLLGMIIKIVTTRYIGDDGIGLYMLIFPTFALFINICQLGFPIAISKMVAEEKKSNKKIIFSIIPVSIILNILLLLIILICSPFISNLLHDDRTLYPLISIGFVLPFISISSIVRGYFFGKEKMIAHITSHIFEQIIRLILIILITPKLLEYSLEAAVTGVVLVNIISELTSIIILIFFLPKKVKIKKEDIIPDKGIIRDILNISLPTTGSRLIGSIGYFFEPIILTFILLKVGYSNQFILNEYGILNGYVLPLLMIPSFFTQAISSALIPVISKSYANHHIAYVRSKIKQGEAISLAIGILVTIVIMLFPDFLLKFIFNTSQGSNYLKLMAPFFIGYYIQTPLTAALQAMNKAKEAMMSTIIGITIKTGLLVLLSILKIGLYGLIVATIVNIFIVTIYNYIKIKRTLNC
ncbi:MAG: oligosaccharide flippase family protein [Bacilli bacterium]|jgi:stage V sporulation protein B